MKRFVPLIFLTIFLCSFAAADSLFGDKKQTDESKRISLDGYAETVQPADLRIDPLLRAIMSSYQDAIRSGKAMDASLARYSELTQIALDYTNRATVQVFVRSTAPGATGSNISALGGELGARVGDILVAAVPVDMVAEIAADQAITYIELSKISQPQLNVSHIEIGSNLVHTNSAGLGQPYTGAGVVVGVLDSGLYFNHPDFWANNTIRVQYLWDMSGQGNPPSGYNYGTEWTAAQMQSGVATQIDGNGGGGHGTHVTGTAAGNGASVAGYVGNAPEADIVFVKGIRDHNSNGGFSDVDVVNGTAYIFNKATQMGKPAVINLSLGGQYGAHDGTSLYEQALDGLTGSGRVIVAAAGNSGSDLIHVSYNAQPGSSYNDALETIWTVNQGSAVSLVDMWYNGGSISVGLAAYDINGFLLGFTNPIAPGQNVPNINFDPGTGTLGIVSIDASVTSDPQNGARRVQFLIDSQNGTWPIDQVFWSVYTFGSGLFDAWVVTGGRFTTDSGTFFRPGDTELTLGIPGTANQIITVGSYVTKTQWIDLNGQTQNQPGNPTIGNISSFSSIGPTRDGRLKPEITAPGEAILSAVSGNLTIGVGIQATDIHVSGFYSKLQGTSMASPHVTGVVGLMLQRNPGLDAATARNILTGTARPVGQPNTTWGYGKISAPAAVGAVPPTGLDDETGNEIASFRLEQNYPNPFNPSTTISYTLPEAADITLSVYNTIGQKVAVLVEGRQSAGEHSTVFEANTLPSGVYFYQLQVGNTSEVRKMMLMK